MLKDALFSEDRKYRYYLKRIWDENLPYAMVIGLNPSTANEEDDDTTIQNLIKLLSGSGYGGLFMMNLFALVSSNPDDLRSCPNPVGDNDKYLKSISDYCDDVFFAWGSFKQAEYRIKFVVKQFPRALCFGRTPNGRPLHPLAATIWQKTKCKIQKYA